MTGPAVALVVASVVAFGIELVLHRWWFAGVLARTSPTGHFGLLFGGGVRSLRRGT